MQLANRKGRAVIVDGSTCVDIHEASDGRFAADPTALFARWSELLAWAEATHFGPGTPFTSQELDAPSPRPTQVFGIGINYRTHAEELGWPIPEVPLVFTKFPSCITGPVGRVELSGPTVDWEVEVVVVIGAGGFRIPASEAWSRIAGITGGQDISDRTVQKLPADKPQFSLGKSFPGFGPIGPVLVTPDEFADVDDISLSCSLNGQEVQRSSTAELVFSIPTLVEYLSHIVPLRPGDLIFTGTPSGIGNARKPPMYLAAGDVLTSEVEQAGEIRLIFEQRSDVPELAGTGLLFSTPAGMSEK